METHFAATSVKLCPGASTKRGRAAGLLAQEAGQEGGDLGAGRPRCGYRPAAARRPGGRIASMPVRGSKAECSRASRAFAIRQPKCRFCSQVGRGGVEGRVALGQGEAAVMRQAFAGRERHLLQRLGRQALHRVAVDVFDAHRKDSSGP